MPPAAKSGDWCEGFKSIGKLHSDADHPWLQEVRVFGRVHYQYGYVDGEAGANGDFNYDTDEFRRMRVGASARFLDVFKVSGEIDYFDDDKARGGDSRGFEFQRFWHLYGSFDAAKALGLRGVDALTVGYGLHEVDVSAEWNTSSKRIKTVERSSIANKIWPFSRSFGNPTGLWVDGRKDDLRWRLGVFSTTDDEGDWPAAWDDGELYYLRLRHDFAAWTGADVSDLLWTWFYQDVGPGQDALGGGLEWASSLSLTYGRDRWQILMEVIYGTNGDFGAGGDPVGPDRQGDFGGFVVLPSCWLIKDKLEAAVRYQYQGSDGASGIRINSRYVRRAESDGAVVIPNGGRGDEHHSVYAGLNYYFCGNNAKVMGGIQYDDIRSGSTDIFDGWTTFLAFRTYF